MLASITKPFTVFYGAALCRMRLSRYRDELLQHSTIKQHRVYAADATATVVISTESIGNHI